MTSRRTGESPTAAPRPPSLTALSAPASPWRPTHHCGEAPGALRAGLRATALLPVGLVGWMVGRDGPLAVSYRSAVSIAMYSEHLLARVPLEERVVVELVVSCRAAVSDCSRAAWTRASLRFAALDTEKSASSGLGAAVSSAGDGSSSLSAEIAGLSAPCVCSGLAFC